MGIRKQRRKIRESNQPGNQQKNNLSKCSFPIQTSKDKEDLFHSDWQLCVGFLRDPKTSIWCAKFTRHHWLFPFSHKQYMSEKKPQNSAKGGCWKSYQGIKHQNPTPFLKPTKNWIQKVGYFPWKVGIFSKNTEPNKLNSEFFRFQTPWRIMASLSSVSFSRLSLHAQDFKSQNTNGSAK